VINMTTREEATKMRKELIRAERILAQKEKAKPQKPDYAALSLGEKNRPEPQSMSSVPNVISLPPKRRPKHENKPFY